MEGVISTQNGNTKYILHTTNEKLQHEYEAN